MRRLPAVLLSLPRACLLPALLLALLAPPARAGGGPETTVVVVNADSPGSRRVANAYAERRGIPASHLVELSGIPTLRIVSADQFRDLLWGPLKQALVERELLESTDLIAWSTDFPFAVDVSADAEAAKLPATPNVPFRAALTSLTYFWRKVERKDAADYLDLTGNRYFSRDGTAGSGGAVSLDAQDQALAKAAEDALRRKDHAAARDALKQLVEHRPLLVVAWYNLACCHALLGEAEAALNALAEAVDKGWSNASATAADSDLASLKDKPEFRALIERMREKAGQVRSSVGFSSRVVWGASGDPLPGANADDSNRYVLSVMLGYSGEWGNSLPEVLTCLERGAGSDGQRPDGTVYLCRSEDMARTGPRLPFFDGTVAALERLGRKARILSKEVAGQDGSLPKGLSDVIGAVLGVAGFTWKDCGSTLLPGAIVEHLTSFGADFSHAGQTKLTEALRGGAAGSSGTVAEPLNYWNKFPVPSLHVHYAAGCSLAEAFFRSLAGPWQTLVVGDPLARPFARFAQVEVALPPAGPLSGTVEVGATVTPAPGTQAASLELWVDGRLRATGPADKPLAWDTLAEADGVHEVRVVALEEGPVATRSWGAAVATVSNAARSATLLGPKAAVDLDDELAFSGKAAGATEVDLLHGLTLLATVPVKGGAFQAKVPAARLGIGLVPVSARARFAQGPAALSAVLPVRVDPPPAAKQGKAAKPAKPAKPAKAGKDGKDAKPAAAPGGKAGLLLRVTDAQGKTHEGELSDLGPDGLAKALAALKVSEAKEVVLEGEVQVAADGFYQLVLSTSGALEVEWGGRTALELKAARANALCFPCATLKAGWNPLKLTLAPAGPPTLHALLAGETVTAPLAPASLRH